MRNFQNYLESFGRKVIAGAKNNLKSIDSNLGSKMRVKVKKVGRGYEVVFTAPEHAKAVDMGVNGRVKKRYYTDYLGQRRKTPGIGYTNKMPPSIIFEKWMKKKGIKGRDKKTGRFQKTKSTAFAMAKNMQLKGRQGLGFFQKPLGLEYKKLNKNVVNAIKKDFKLEIESINK